MAWPSHARQNPCTWACPRRPSSASSQSRVHQIHLRRGSLGTDTRSVRCAVTTAVVAAYQPRAGSLSKVRQTIYFGQRNLLFWSGLKAFLLVLSGLMSLRPRAQIVLVTKAEELLLAPQRYIPFALELSAPTGCMRGKCGKQRASCRGPRGPPLRAQAQAKELCAGMSG